MTKCPNCGYQSEPDKAFCAQCGARLTPQATPQAKPSKPDPSLAEPPVATNNTQTRKAPRPSFPLKRIAQGLIAVLVVVLLAGGGLWAWRGTLPGLGDFPFADQLRRWLGGGPTELIELAPASAELYLDARIGADSDAWAQLQTLWARFPKAESWWDGFTTSLTVTDEESTPQVMWERDVRPWLGERVGLAIDLNDAEQDNLLTGDLAILFDVTDQSKVDTFLDKLLQTQQVSRQVVVHQGQSITQLSAVAATETPEQEAPTPASAGYLVQVNDYLVISNSLDYVKRMIDDWKAVTSFANKPGVETALSSMPKEETWGRLLIDTQSLDPAAFEWLALPSWLFGLPAAQTAEAQQAALPPLIGFSVVPENDALHISQTLPELTQPYPLDGFTPALAEAIPAGVIAYAGGDNLKAALDRYVDLLAASDPAIKTAYEALLAQFESEEADLSLENDLLGWLDQEFGLTVQLVNELPQFSFVTRPSDATDAAARLDKITSFFESLLILQSGLDGNPVQLDPETFQLLAPVDLSGTEAFQLQYAALPTYLQPTYAFVDGLFVLSSSPAALQQFVEVQQGARDSLLSNPTFLANYQQLPGEVTGLAYVDRTSAWQLIDTVYQTTATSIEGRINFDQLNQDLAPWPGMFVFQRATADGGLITDVRLPITSTDTTTR